MGKYIQLYDGDSVTVVRDKEWRFACCDCGLVHRITFQNHRNSTTATISRDNRRTAATRRGKVTKEKIKQLQRKG